MLSTRLDFSSETDVRKSRALSITPANSSSSTTGRHNIQHSNSSSALRTSDYYHQVTYAPQSTAPITNPPRSQSVYPSSTHIPSSLSASSLSIRPTPPPPPPTTTTATTNTNNIYASTTSLSSTASGGTTIAATGKGLGTNNIPLTRKSITEYSNRTFRVVFSDDSAMIIREDSPDGQIFIDTQGKRYSFDRRT
jgi:hypothetical protein